MIDCYECGAPLSQHKPDPAQAAGSRAWRGCPDEPSDLLDMAVECIAADDYNHVPEAVLRRRLATIRGTYMETRLEEEADAFIAAVRDTLTDGGDPEYGPDDV